jgi:ATPase subunit of ABC transporter with duplicated ATPase domains
MALPNEINFLSLSHGQAIPNNLRNTFVIRGDNWNDYNNYVRFDLYWVGETGPARIIGKTKILQGSDADGDWRVVADTKPPESFINDIGDRYVSLGQSELFYGWLFTNFGQDAIRVLSALRDIAVRPGLAGRFETSTAFRNGMMRENVARRSLRFGSAWARGLEPDEKPGFSYVCRLGEEEAPFEIEFDFRPGDILPGRVVGIIGRNAVGKTRFLAQLSVDLAQVRQISAETVEERASRFPGGQPLFTRIMAVSYSAFDSFRRPAAHDRSSYVYCGIRDEKGNLSQTGLQRTYRANKRRVRDLNRDYEWTEHIAKILGENGQLRQPDLLSEIRSDEPESALLGRLSSGQAILCHFVTGLLAWLQPESLVLFDEPETHLHPNAVSNLFEVLTDILHVQKSYAVVATHSPIVIQEIPSKRVVVFTREDGETSVEYLRLESFGESIAELTDHVFKTHESTSLYRHTLDQIARRMSFEEALALFPNRLSLNAKSYLLARYAREPS